MTTQYLGTKHIQAEPMNRADYNRFRGWDLPADEIGTDEGYLVEYLDGGTPNVKGRNGYVSWSPKEQFENAYQPFSALSFGHAVVLLKSNERVARAGWNGKGMWLMLVPGDSNFSGVGYENLPYIVMKTADNKIVPWLASQTDILADDWQVVPG